MRYHIFHNEVRNANGHHDATFEKRHSLFFTIKSHLYHPTANHPLGGWLRLPVAKRRRRKTTLKTPPRRGDTFFG
ncbi:MAG: hypothetical protein K2J68_01215 [Treponemataceae bacterium]|nr:hypothetical protein [Treponemataceae bacterium]